MKLECWNVNGLRAAYRKGFIDFVWREEPDILCVQEVKAEKAQLPRELKSMAGYHLYVSAPDDEKDKGWSGVALFSKTKPRKVEYGFGEERFDNEGRTIVAHFSDFILLNIYFPNGKASRERLQYKLDFYDAFLRFARRLMDEGEELVVCGDVNTAHKEIDLARPRENSKISGFLPEEREWLDRFAVAGLIDTFREFDPSPGKFSFWDSKTKARERDVGWRIDYVYVSKGLRPRLKEAFILKEVQGSDHCPVGIVLE
jgi:exodeoxyribonuclease-3